MFVFQGHCIAVHYACYATIISLSLRLVFIRLIGAKVPNENLNPEQRKLREEKLGFLNELNRQLFPDEGQGPGGPGMHGPNMPQGPGGPGGPPGPMHGMGPMGQNFMGPRGMMGGPMGPGIRGYPPNNMMGPNGRPMVPMPPDGMMGPRGACFYCTTFIIDGTCLILTIILLF